MSSLRIQADHQRSRLTPNPVDWSVARSVISVCEADALGGREDLLESRSEDIQSIDIEEAIKAAVELEDQKKSCLQILVLR